MISIVNSAVFVSSAAACYATLKYGVVFDYSMIVPAHIFNSVKYLKTEVFTEKLAYKAQGTYHLAARQRHMQA
ncbi:phosphoethanolamine transferase domain-containing protein [Moritella yayanosii]|nr:phosphoethanolamine transferase domain-containing protein [Moritella yayanosii]